MLLTVLYLALAAYVAAALFGAHYVRAGTDASPRRAHALATVGLVAHTAFLVGWGTSHGRLPTHTPFEALVLLLWCVVAVYFVVNASLRLRALPGFVMPLVALGGLATVAFTTPHSSPAAVTRSWWVVLHAVASWLGAADFLLAFAGAVMYLLQQRLLKRKSVGPLMARLPSLDALDRLNYRAIALGMPVFSLALISGVVLAMDRGPGWWATWSIAASILVWAVYALLLHARLGAGIRGPKVAYLTIVGSVLIALVVCGMIFLGDSIHRIGPQGRTRPVRGTEGARHAP